MWLMTVGLALASPTVTIGDDGAVVGHVQVSVPPAVLIEHLEDPQWLPEVSQSGTRATVLKVDGPCTVLDMVSPSSVMTVQYRVKRCPHAQGFASTLVESDTFTAYSARWTITPTESGSQIRYDLITRTNLWIPRGIIRSQTRSAVNRTLQHIAEWSDQHTSKR